MSFTNKNIILFCVSVLLFSTTVLKAQQTQFIMDMVHHNPGEALAKSAFTNPEYVKQSGFNVQVMNFFSGIT